MSQTLPVSASEEMIRRQLVERGITDPRVLEAMRSVPRERFFSPGLAKEAYADQAAPIGFGQRGLLAPRRDLISKGHFAIAEKTEQARAAPLRNIFQFGLAADDFETVASHFQDEIAAIGAAG